MARDIAGRISGEISLSWTTRPYVLSGRPIIKISLKTGDEATRARWAEVHAQVEASIGEATRKTQQRNVAATHDIQSGVSAPLKSSCSRTLYA
ncbi:MAG: hypothetical protein KGL46_04675 [Hyphomicrobiales bacterium]|nr:hypothetical protein [Hyphomicrobiales bacterium]